MIRPLLNLLRNEPVMAFVVALAFVLALLIHLDRISLVDVSGFVETFGEVLVIVGPVLLGGTWLRSKVTPTAKTEG